MFFDAVLIIDQMLSYSSYSEQPVMPLNAMNIRSLPPDILDQSVNQMSIYGLHALERRPVGSVTFSYCRTSAEWMAKGMKGG